jgi:chromosome segregation ATPase
MASMGQISDYTKGSHDKTQINELNARIKSNEEEIQRYKDDIAKYQDKNSEEYKNLQEKYLQRYKALSDSFDTAQKAGTKAASDNAKKLEDAAKKIAEAEEKVAEATKKLNETLYGTEYHKDSLDLLYNYSTNLERLEKKATDAKEALEDLGHVENAKENMSTYLSNTHASIVNRQA